VSHLSFTVLIHPEATMINYTQKENQENISTTATELRRLKDKRSKHLKYILSLSGDVPSFDVYYLEVLENEVTVCQQHLHRLTELSAHLPN
jgi:hypothetical protein